MDNSPELQAPSASTPEGPTQTGHTRTYQACIPCRRRKVRCDLGPPDKPHDPPCKRCRRESKDCYFSATRRKKRPDASEEAEDGHPSEYEIRNGRKRPRPDTVEPSSPIESPATRNSNIKNDAAAYSNKPLMRVAPSNFNGPLQPPGSSTKADDEDQQASNHTAALLQKGELYGPHDALTLLFEAAGRTGDMENHRTGSSHSQRNSITVGRPSPVSPNNVTDSRTGRLHMSAGSIQRAQQLPHEDLPIDPAITRPQNSNNYATSSPDRESAIRAWSRFRFVRASWFTAQEAIDYIEYFYIYFAWLTPIVLPDFRDLSTHAKLLSEEPMLAITMLMLSSRYMALPPGPGAVTRPYAIHDKLWNYLQSTIDRMLWGQEQFGGGFCGAGARFSDGDHKGLRTLGTVESLLLLTEWHPRTLHFPPGVDSEALLEPDELQSRADGQLPTANTTPSQKESWLEPCWRSDRMCWMLLGNAMALAIELGVFDQDKKNGASQLEQPQDEISLALQTRKDNVKKLLLIYVTQISGRLGYISMLPRNLSEPSYLKNQAKAMGEKLESLRSAGALPKTLPSQPSPEDVSIIHETVLYLWMEVAVTFQLGNEDLFPNLQHTRDIIQSGKYVELMEFYNNLLQQWRHKFDQFNYIPVHMRAIIMIEYEYSRVFINAIALQAVVERCINNTSTTAQTEANLNGHDVPSNVISPSTLMKWSGRDRQYINIIAEASRNLLTIVVDVLLSGNFLKHAPVRTYFRIISVGMLMLKTFALGTTEGDLAKSLSLLERAAEALKTCIVDDVHVASRFAEILELLIGRMKSRFVRLASSGGADRSSRAPSRSPAPGQQQSGQPLSNIYNIQQPSQDYGHLAVQQQQWSGYNNASQHAHPFTPSGRATPSNPLYGISADTHDPFNSGLSIMPPPTFATHPVSDGGNNTSWYNTTMQTSGTGADGTYGVADDGSTDWLAIPLNPLLDFNGADVTQSLYGPDVNGYDMLEVLLGLEGNMGR
ncbi:MAG: hypothetical protein M1820_001049 [Bogoriella megaspora]|nr:MAG: hypothetical protein M1820_001049 [Bogoriella megaspora]